MVQTKKMAEKMGYDFIIPGESKKKDLFSSFGGTMATCTELAFSAGKKAVGFMEHQRRLIPRRFRMHYFSGR